MIIDTVTAIRNLNKSSATAEDGRPERDVVRFVKPPLCMTHDVVRFVKNPLKPPSVGGFGPPSNTWSLLSRARCVPKIIPIA